MRQEQAYPSIPANVLPQILEVIPPIFHNSVNAGVRVYQETNAKLVKAESQRLRDLRSPGDPAAYHMADGKDSIQSEVTVDSGRTVHRITKNATRPRDIFVDFQGVLYVDDRKSKILFRPNIKEIDIITIGDYTTVNGINVDDPAVFAESNGVIAVGHSIHKSLRLDEIDFRVDDDGALVFCGRKTRIQLGKDARLIFRLGRHSIFVNGEEITPEVFVEDKMAPAEALATPAAVKSHPIAFPTAVKDLLSRALIHLWVLLTTWGKGDDDDDSYDFSVLHPQPKNGRLRNAEEFRAKNGYLWISGQQTKIMVDKKDDEKVPYECRGTDIYIHGKKLTNRIFVEPGSVKMEQFGHKCVNDSTDATFTAIIDPTDVHKHKGDDDDAKYDYDKLYSQPTTGLFWKTREFTAFKGFLFINGQKTKIRVDEAENDEVPYQCKGKHIYVHRKKLTWQIYERGGTPIESLWFLCPHRSIVCKI